MERNGGAVNGWTVNPQLTVKLSVFSPLQSLINQSSALFGAASRRCPSLVPVAAAYFHSLLMEFAHVSIAWPAPSATSSY
jgi:hypothetical protein